MLTVIGPLQKVVLDGLYGWLVVKTVAWVVEVLAANEEVPLNTAEMVREPSSAPGKVTFVCACPEPLTGTAAARTGPIPALVPVLSWKVTVPAVTGEPLDVTVAVSVTGVAVVASPLTLLLV